jgi:SSS family solute:Na+ symporter
MNLALLDIISFIGFLLLVIAISLYMSRKEKSTEDYFLAGRGLSWWLIGFSLIASNISTEHFVGMAGRGFELGLAIASYEWMAAVTLVVVALFLLPRFLRAGIYTILEYLEYRYGPGARTLMAVFMLAAYLIVALASVLYSGALALSTIFDIPLVPGIWLIGILAGLYTVYGGLKAVVWSDLLQGIALLLGGIFVTVLAFQEMGGLQEFLTRAEPKLHTVLPWNHDEMPWLAVFIGGLWIPNLFYWGLNQFITQRSLAAKSLADGQKGILFAALMKLFIPFIIIFPGIIAFELYGNAIPSPDQAYPFLIRELLPSGIKGIMLAALFGAVMSSLDSMLNSAATIFTMDLFKKYISPNHAQKSLVRVGRVATAIMVVLACLWSPIIGKFESVFSYIQMIWGFLSPGIVAVFFLGMLDSRISYRAALLTMFMNIPIYGALLFALPEVAFLHHMGITFILLVGIAYAVSKWYPDANRPVMPVQENFPMESSGIVKGMALLVVVLTIALYIVFF